MESKLTYVKTFDKTRNIEIISIVLYFANATLVLHIKVKKDFLKYHSPHRVRSFNRKKIFRNAQIFIARGLCGCESGAQFERRIASQKTDEIFSMNVCVMVFVQRIVRLYIVIVT